MSSSFTVVGTIISYLLIIGGWLFVRHDNNLRERRKELRAQLDTASKDVDAIVELSKAFYSVHGRDNSAALKREQILSSLKVLGTRTQVVTQAYPSFTVSTQLIGFRKSITGALTGFDDPDRNSAAEGGQICIDIFRAAALLKVVLELQYQKIFHRSG
jgi:hypothetical protein